MYGTINVSEIKIIRTGKINTLFRLSNIISKKLKSNLDKIFEKKESSVLKGILLGDISDIEDEVYENFQISNMAHILAVSGMHVSYIIIGINLLLKDKVGKRKIKYILIAFLVFYMFITGFSPSIVRATLMNIFIIFSEIVYRKNDIWTSISFSLLIILIYNPFLILNIGLKLSYIGTISIILFNKNTASLLDEKLKIKNSKIKNILSVIFSVQIGILPIVLYEFNYIGIYFIITNLIVSVIIGPIVCLGLLFSIISFFNIFICQKISFVLEIPIKLLIQISNFSKLPFSKIYIPTPKLWKIIMYYIVVLVIKFFYKVYSKEQISNTEHRIKNLVALVKYRFNSLKRRIYTKRKKEKISIYKLFIIIIIFVLVLFFLINLIPKNLKIYFVDVNQGDCTFIITPKNKTILIDGGGSESTNFDIGKRTLIPFVLDKGYNKIDYIIISHFDQDHVGGLLTVMEELKVGQVIISKQEEDSENYQKFKEIVNEKKIKVRVVNKGDRVSIEKNLYFDIFWPNSEKMISDNILNNNSIVCKLNYKDFSMLFTGDIEEIAEKEILQEYKNNLQVLNSTVLKVGHHGSKTSSTQEFIEIVKPKIALIGVGENNKFGHPNEEVIERLDKLRAKIYRTDQMGEISIIVNGKRRIKVKEFIWRNSN